MALGTLEEEIRKITNVIEWNFRHPETPKEFVLVPNLPYSDPADLSVLVYEGRYYGTDFMGGDTSTIPYMSIILRQKLNHPVQNYPPGLIPGDTIMIELRQRDGYALAELTSNIFGKRYKIRSGKMGYDREG